MNEPLISVVVPVHNAAPFIEETVASVLAQTEGDFELLLVEDASSDGSPEIMKRLEKTDERIRVIINHGTHGAAYARNLGSASSKGRYLCFLDADDIWLPEKLEEELDFLRKKDAAFVFTAYEFADKNGKGTGRYVRVPEMLDYEHALSRTVIFTSTVMFDMEKLSKDHVKMPYIKSEDTACWWKILGSGVTAFGLDKSLVLYRRAGESLSSNKIEAVKRIWYLYRVQEELPFFKSVACFISWAVRASLRRL